MDWTEPVRPRFLSRLGRAEQSGLKIYNPAAYIYFMFFENIDKEPILRVRETLIFSKRSWKIFNVLMQTRWLITFVWNRDPQR